MFITPITSDSLGRLLLDARGNQHLPPHRPLQGCPNPQTRRNPADPRKKKLLLPAHDGRPGRQPHNHRRIPEEDTEHRKSHGEMPKILQTLSQVLAATEKGRDRSKRTTIDGRRNHHHTPLLNTQTRLTAHDAHSPTLKCAKPRTRDTCPNIQ
jgi:hypothetical protein